MELKDQFVVNAIHLAIEHCQMFKITIMQHERKKWPKLIAKFMVLMMIVIE
jgi:hypothetical protein